MRTIKFSYNFEVRRPRCVEQITIRQKYSQTQLLFIINQKYSQTQLLFIINQKYSQTQILFIKVLFDCTSA